MVHGVAVTVWREAVRDKQLALNQHLKGLSIFKKTSSLVRVRIGRRNNMKSYLR